MISELAVIKLLLASVLNKRRYSMNLKKYVKTLLRANFKMLYVNFKCLPFKQAIKLPILLSWRCVITELSGRIIINSDITPGMIIIGYGNVGLFNGTKPSTILKIEGILEFDGKANIGYGSKLDIGKTGTLKLGRNFSISAATSIICHKSIVIGNNCVLSWDILFMDTDLHEIKDTNGNVINEPKEIIIGDNVWIGCRCLILKGTDIGNGNVIAANSTLTKSYQQQNCVLTGDKVLKQDITWEV